MSNRPRRRLLREWRMLALVLNDAAPPDPDSIQSLEEWNRLHRDAFRFLWREPLRFPNNIRQDAWLINIQARNQPEFFNPLAGDSAPERPEHHRENGRLNDLWDKTEEAIYSALDYLEPARRITRALFISDPAATPEQGVAPAWPGAPPGYMHFFEDYPARFYRGFRKLRTSLSVTHQYGGNGNPWFRDHGSAVRNILGLDERITEPELYALLILAACWWALHELQRLPESWTRDDLDYIAGKVRDGERWLAEAYRLKQSDAREATVRAEEDAKKAAIQEKADREKADVQAKADFEMAAIQDRADAEKAAIQDALKQADAQIRAMAQDAERGERHRNRLALMNEEAKKA